MKACRGQGWRIDRHTECSRGLAWVATVQRHADTEALVGMVDRVLADVAGAGIIGGRERWGPREVHRRIVPFLVELRVGTAPGRFEIHWRATATPALRRRFFERLTAALARELTVAQGG